MSLLERGNTRLAPLDTVEPDFEVENRPYPHGIVPVPDHGRYYCIRQLKAELLPHGTTFYSRETVESLLSQCRKEALLEAADGLDGLHAQYVSEYQNSDQPNVIREYAARASSIRTAQIELRRIAESTMEGEKHE